jgi:type II secretory pathway component GspD/PulD (secretin)
MHNLIRCMIYRFPFLIIFILFGLAPGCSFIEPRPVIQKDIDEINPRAIIQREKEVKPPGPPPFSEKLNPATTGLAKQTKLYSLVFEKAPLSQVINAITNDTDLNLSVESAIDLARPVTVKLKNVTFKEALDMAVVKGADYAWKIEDDTLYIKRLEERIYHLDYLDMSGEIEIEVGGDMLATSVEDAGVAGKFLIKGKKTVENTDVWAEVKATLETLKSSNGVIRINRTAGIIYMADAPRKLACMVQFLDSLSEALHRQVFIEAKIMEVVLSDDSRYGIDWTKLNVAFKSDLGSLPDSLLLDFNRGGTIVLSDESAFAGILDFLNTQGDVSVLSNPHLSVMNRQSALMTVGVQFPYADIDGVDRDTYTNVTTYGVNIKRAVLGLQLGITPQISPNGIVTLNIVPTITRIMGEEKIELPTSGTSAQTISNPIIALEEIATMVRVRTGNSVVLAGLISQIKQLDHEGLPWFSKIPFIGPLFKNIEQSLENKELVIFITPYIKNVI